METAQRRFEGATRRIVVMMVGLVLLALVAGGAGGYLIRGATTLAVTQTTVANPAVAGEPAGSALDHGGLHGVFLQPVTGPLFTEPHDSAVAARAGTAPSRPLFTEPHDVMPASAPPPGPLFTEPHDVAP